LDLHGWIAAPFPNLSAAAYFAPATVLVPALTIARTERRMCLLPRKWRQ
jgi:hypothetical protein